MGWDTGEENKSKNGMELTTKILIGIIICIVMIISLTTVLLLHISQTTYTISVNGRETTQTSKKTLLTQIDNVTYVNIEEFARLANYAYHKGEYKNFTIDEDKCYVQGEIETASFYKNDNKVCKLLVGNLTDDYQEYTIQHTVRKENGIMYASLDAIELAFNAIVKEDKKSFSIYTLDYLVKTYNKKVKNWGYTGTDHLNFENKKAILYGYLIVKKEKGLYKIIDSNNSHEIVSDRYNSIQFTENTKEFFVTNSLDQVGIINLDGTTKIEPVYDAISVLDKKEGFYLIQKDKKYGIIKSGNIIILHPEYDQIGIENSTNTALPDNQYELFNQLIPACKKNKWGLFDKKGNAVLKAEFDQIGCLLTSVTVQEQEKTVLPVVEIKECNGIVVKKGDNYGLVNLEGKELVPIAVDAIYGIRNALTEEITYYMLYNNEELNLMERLRLAGLVGDNSTTTENRSVSENTIENNIDMTNTVPANTVANISEEVAN